MNLVFHGDNFYVIFSGSPRLLGFAGIPRRIPGAPGTWDIQIHVAAALDRLLLGESAVGGND